MGRINELVKFTIMHVNFVYSFCAIVLMGFSIFVMVGDWGGLDPAFFLGWGMVGLLFGSLILIISVLGCQGVNHQTVRTGFFTGKRILTIYQLCLVGTIVGDIFLVTILLVTRNSLDDQLDGIAENDGYVEYNELERQISDRFNDFFFSATESCTDTKTLTFWSWVDDHCPEAMDTANCQGCDDYSITSCPHDERSCYKDIPDGTAPWCPYEMCREGVLNYFTNYISAISIYMLCFTIVQFVLIFLTCMLICYTPRDTMENMLVKAGTIQKAENPEQQRNNISNTQTQQRGRQTRPPAGTPGQRQNYMQTPGNDPGIQMQARGDIDGSRL